MLLVILLFLTVALLAYANGANDNFKAVATIYGSSTLSYRASLILATVAQLAGSIASVALAGALLKAFGGKGLVPDGVVANPSFLVAVGVGAAATVLLATRLGMPISTTHALIGGLTGAGLAIAPSQFAWGGLGPKYMLPLIVSPFLAVSAAALIYPILSHVRRRLGIDDQTCLCVGRAAQPVTLTTEGTMVMQESGLELTVEQAQQCQSRYDGSVVGISAQRVVDVVHLVSGFSLGFARGLNDTPKVMALLVAGAWTGLPPRVALGIIALVMAAGGLLHSARLAQTMGKRITSMNTGQGLLANLVASGLVIGASLAGSPVSTTHVSTGAIFGIGMWTGRADWKVVTEIVLAWLVTLPVAGGLAYVVAMM